MQLFLLKLFIFVISAKSACSSIGDRSPFYIKCVEKCLISNCSDQGILKAEVLSLYPSFFMWSCHDDCNYICMWKTVDGFIQRSWPIPQFYGKWPFVRIFGLQEPASVLFSFLNFYSNLYMLGKFRKEVRKTSPMYLLWHVYSIICLNCWFWACIFHARDFPFTEKMDYLSAFLMILFSFYSMCYRILNGRLKWLKWTCLLACSFLAFHHITYLIFVKFDYGYNMLVNIVVGASNAVGWLLWCWCNRQHPHVWRCALFVILTGICTALEVADFPPLFWCFDSHSLWHLGTSALPLLFYRFLIDDCKYLKKVEDMNFGEKLLKDKYA